MKKALLAIALTASFTGSAFAADLPMKGRALAPAPAPVGYSWTGCYLGAGGGYGMFVQRHRTIDPFGVPFTAGETDTGGKGWFGTVQVGCDYQFAERWVIGAFADYDFSGIKGNFQPTGLIGTGGLGLYGEEKLKSSWAAGGRVGYLVVPALLAYVSGGYTEARFDGVALSNLFDNVPTIASLASQTYKGWFIGTGYEYGISFLPGLFWKTEYRYASYSAERPAYFGVGIAGAAAGLAFSEDSRKDVQTIRSELVYRFNFGGGRY